MEAMKSIVSTTDGADAGPAPLPIILDMAQKGPLFRCELGGVRRTAADIFEHQCMAQKGLHGPVFVTFEVAKAERKGWKTGVLT